MEIFRHKMRVYFGDINVEADITVDGETIQITPPIKYLAEISSDIWQLENGDLKFYLTRLDIDKVKNPIIEENAVWICPSGAYKMINGEPIDITDEKNDGIIILDENMDNKNEKGAGVMLIEGDKYVLFKDLRTGLYTNPGGFAEQFEDAAMTAARELFEETAGTLRIKPSDIASLPSVKVDDHVTFILHLDEFPVNAYNKNLKALGDNPWSYSSALQNWGYTLFGYIRGQPLLENYGVIKTNVLDEENIRPEVFETIMRIKDFGQSKKLKKGEQLKSKYYRGITSYTL